MDHSQQDQERQDSDQATETNQCNEGLIEGSNQKSNLRRNCPVHVEVDKFLAEAMRSISSIEWDKIKRRPRLVVIVNHCNQQNKTENPPDLTLNSEEFLARDQDAAEIRSNILSLFDDDIIARTIVLGTFDGLSAENLRDLTGLDETVMQANVGSYGGGSTMLTLRDGTR